VKKYLLPISLGLFSITAQALLVRDFLHCIEENEFTLGFLYFFWFFWIVPGTITGKLLQKYSSLLPISSLLYIPSWLWGHFLIRNSRYISDIPAYEVFNIHTLLFYSAIVPAGISFLTGLLFTHCAIWWQHNIQPNSIHGKDSPPAIVRSVYAYESLGAVLGGFITSICIFRGFSHWLPFCFASGTLLTSVFLFLNHKTLKKILLSFVPFLILLAFPLETWENKYLWSSINKNEKLGGKIITQKGEYLYGYKANQLILLRNLKPALNFPNPEYGLRLLSTFLAQKNDGKRILLIGEPFLYTLPYLTKIQEIENITWIPFDSELSKILIPLLPEEPLQNQRKLIYPQSEPLSFLKNTTDTFDIILIYTSEPQTIASNHFLTDHFFSLLKTRLADKGIAGIRISGGENFLGGEIATLGASIYLTFHKIFNVTALKPGEETWLFGSINYPLSEHVPTLEKRLSALIQHTPEIKPGIVRDLYPADRIIFQRNRYEEVKNVTTDEYLINTEAKYLGFLYNILLYLWKQGYSGILEKIPIFKKIVIFLLFFSPLIFILSRGIYKKKSFRKGVPGYLSNTLEICFAIFMIGTAGMGISFLLLIQYQYNYGTLSTYIGLLSSMFMMGLSTSPHIYNYFFTGKNKKLFFFITTFVFTLCICSTFLILHGIHIYFYFYLFTFFAWGFALGLLLSISLDIFKKEFNTSQVAMYLEAWDHLGAGFASLIFPIILLPLLGLKYSIGFTFFCITVVLAPLLLLQKIPIYKTSLWGRPPGYTLIPILIITFISTEIYYSSKKPLPEDTFTKIAKEMAEGEDISLKRMTLSDNRQFRYYTYTKKDSNQNENTFYIFSTASLFKVMGYGGEIDVAVKVTKDGTIENLKVIQSKETPDYLSRVEDYFFLYKGKSIFQPESISVIDTISGATTTSDAIKRAVQFAGKEFANIIQNTKIGYEETQSVYNLTNKTTYSKYIFLLSILMAIIIRFFYNDLLRTLWLVTISLVLGFWLNIQYGIYSIVQLLSIDNLHLHFSVSTLLTIGIPILVLINGNIYCGYICPFGAMAELISKFNYISKRIFPTKPIWYSARQFKYILAFLFLLIYICLRDIKLASVDPLLTFFTLDTSNLTTIFGICVLLASLLYNRFWCRVLCPTGAFLSLIQSLRIFSFFWQRTFPAHCDLGISRPEEIDCIQCNRCYKHEKK